MKIVFTGAGGGHFYPIIAIAEKIKEEILIEKILDSDMYFLSDKNYDEKILNENKIKFIKIPSGKLTPYFSLENILTPFISLFGFFLALVRLFIIYPDIVFAKGGYASFPVLLAARILFIPIFIHESDSVPGKTTVWAGKFAKRIATSYSAALTYFPTDRTAYTGPIIQQKYLPTKEKLEYKLDKQKDFFKNKKDERKNILILGGSQGAEKINNIVLQLLPRLLEDYNIIHQVGENHFAKIKIATTVILKDNLHKENYHYFAFDNLAKYYPETDLCITRAGSTLFELSAWGIPSIVIPISVSNGNHQRSNAYLFEKAGCSFVMEENNLTPNIFLNNIKNILTNEDKYSELVLNNLKTFKPGAANLIAKEIIKIGLSHNY